ncbi:hypothetical protein V8F33_002670 [Rhypophila sp. PSN 637]
MARIQLIWSWLLLFALTAWAIPIARRDAQAVPQPAAWTQDLVNTLAHSPEEAELVEQLVSVLANSPEETAFLNALYSTDSEPTRKLAKRIQGGWVLNNGVWFYDSTMTEAGERWIGPLSMDSFTFKAKIRRNFDVQNIWEKIKGTWYSVKGSVKNTWSNFKEVAINIFNKLNPFRKGPFIPYGANESSGTLASQERKLSEPERLVPPSMMYGTPDEYSPHQHLAAQPNGKQVDQQHAADDGFEHLDPNVEHIEKVKSLKSPPPQNPPPKSHSPEIFAPRPMRVIPPIPISEEEEQEFLDSYKDKGKGKAVPQSESGREFELLRNKGKSKAIPLPPPPKTEKDLEYERLAQQTRGPSPLSPASTTSEEAAKPLYASRPSTSDIPVTVSPTRGERIIDAFKRPFRKLLGKESSPASPKVTNRPTTTDENVGRPLPTYSVADESPRKLYPFWGSPREDLLDPVERDFFIDPSNPFGVFQNPDPFLAELAKAEKNPETKRKFVADLENKADRLVEEYDTQYNKMQNREAGWETKGRAVDAWSKALWPAEKERLEQERAERERKTGIKEEGEILPNWSDLKDKAAIKIDLERFWANNAPMPGAWPESVPSSRGSSESGASSPSGSESGPSSIAQGSVSTASYNR